MRRKKPKRDLRRPTLLLLTILLVYIYWFNTLDFSAPSSPNIRNNLEKYEGTRDVWTKPKNTFDVLIILNTSRYEQNENYLMKARLEEQFDALPFKISYKVIFLFEIPSDARWFNQVITVSDRHIGKSLVSQGFILIAPNDTFINLEQLFKFLRSKDPNELSVYMSQLAFRKPKPTEPLLRKQALVPLILSRSAFSKVKANMNRFPPRSEVDLGQQSFWSQYEIKLHKVKAMCNGYLQYNERSEVSCDSFAPYEFILKDNASPAAIKIMSDFLLKDPEGFYQPSPFSNEVSEKVTIVFKHISEYRWSYIGRLVESIRTHYPKIKVIISDDSTVAKTVFDLKIDEKYKDPNLIEVITLHIDSGLSYARNRLVGVVKTPYTLLIDDDNILWKGTDIGAMLTILEEGQEFDLVGGVYYDINTGFDVAPKYSYGLDISSNKNQDFYLNFTAKPVQRVLNPDASTMELSIESYDCRATFMTHNFFLARTKALLKSPWRDELVMNEHEMFFLDFSRNGYKVLECPHISILHDKQSYASMSMSAYKSHSKRYTSFCPAFRKLCGTYNLRSLLTPWYDVDCRNHYVCYLHGSMNRAQQLNTQDVDWMDDPIRRGKCMDFDHPLCDSNAQPEEVESVIRNSPHKLSRRIRQSQRQLKTKPADWKSISW